MARLSKLDLLVWLRFISQAKHRPEPVQRHFGLGQPYFSSTSMSCGVLLYFPIKHCLTLISAQSIDLTKRAVNTSFNGPFYCQCCLYQYVVCSYHYVVDVYLADNNNDAAIALIGVTLDTTIATHTTSRWTLLVWCSTVKTSGNSLLRRKKHRLRLGSGKVVTTRYAPSRCIDRSLRWHKSHELQSWAEHFGPFPFHQKHEGKHGSFLRRGNYDSTPSRDLWYDEVSQQHDKRRGQYLINCELLCTYCLSKISRAAPPFHIPQNISCGINYFLYKYGLKGVATVSVAMISIVYWWLYFSFTFPGCIWFIT